MAALIVQRRKIKQSEKRILLAEIGGIQFLSHSLNVSIMSQYYAMLHRNVSGSKNCVLSVVRIFSQDMVSGNY